MSKNMIQAAYFAVVGIVSLFVAAHALVSVSDNLVDAVFPMSAVEMAHNKKMMEYMMQDMMQDGMMQDGMMQKHMMSDGMMSDDKAGMAMEGTFMMVPDEGHPMSNPYREPIKSLIELIIFGFLARWHVEKLLTSAT